jgi:hypothetical protein
VGQLPPEISRGWSIRAFRPTSSFDSLLRRCGPDCRSRGRTSKMPPGQSLRRCDGRGARWRVGAVALEPLRCRQFATFCPWLMESWCLWCVRNYCTGGIGVDCAFPFAEPVARTRSLVGEVAGAAANGAVRQRYAPDRLRLRPPCGAQHLVHAPGPARVGASTAVAEPLAPLGSLLLQVLLKSWGGGAWRLIECEESDCAFGWCCCPGRCFRKPVAKGEGSSA